VAANVHALSAGDFRQAAQVSFAKEGADTHDDWTISRAG
jgi:hypothetical protein